MAAALIDRMSEDGLDPARRALRQALADAGLSLKDASRAIGRNDAYLQQYLFRQSPRRLPEALRHRLAALTGTDQQTLADDDIRTIQNVSQNASTTSPATGIGVPIFDVRASAGGGAMADNNCSTDQLGFPASLLRRITTAPADGLQMISIRGDSMEPTLQDGDLVMIDTTHTRPSPPGIFVLDDGVGLVAKRVDTVPNSQPQILRLSSDNPAYANYQRRIDEVHIIGRLVWFGRSL